MNSSRWPCPASPPMPRISPRRRVERDVAHARRRAGRAPRAPARSPRRAAAVGVGAVDRAPGHQRHRLGLGDLRSRVATCSPLRNTVIRSARSSTSRQRCEVKMTHAPVVAQRAARCPKSHSTSRSAQRRGRLVEEQHVRLPASARTNSTTWRCATERLDAELERVDAARRRTRRRSRPPAPASARRRIRPQPPPRRVAQQQVLRHRHQGISVSSWKTVPMPERLRARRARTSGDLVAPDARRCPRPGRSTPQRILISVLLPAPFSPTRAWTSPKRALNAASRSARTPPKDVETPIASMARRRRRPGLGGARLDHHRCVPAVARLAGGGG